MEYESMTLGELEALNQELGAKKEDIRQEQMRVKAAMDKVIARQHAENILAGVDANILADILNSKAIVGGVA